MVALSVVAMVLLAALVAGGAGEAVGGVGACAPPPHGSHSVETVNYGRYLQAYGPPLVTFLVFAYFTLGRRSRTGRVLFGVLTLTMTMFVTFATMTMQVGCGV
jgi:hypothetical protein